MSPGTDLMQSNGKDKDTISVYDYMADQQQGCTARVRYEEYRESSV